MDREKCVLVAEDELAIRQLLEVTLEDLAPLVVVGDGAEAIAQLSQRTFDVLVLDLMMPRVSGFDVIGSLAGNGAPKVVVVTAMPDRDVDRVRPFVHAVIRKPFRPEVLRNVVRELLG